MRLIDATTVREPGSKGIPWRVHYAIDLASLRCEELHLTDVSVGESFRLFNVRPGELIVGDRGFANRANVRHVTRAGAAVLVRLNLTNLPLCREDGRPFPRLKKLRGLSRTAPGDWPVWVRDGRARIPARVCALRKSK